MLNLLATYIHGSNRKAMINKYKALATLRREMVSPCDLYGSLESLSYNLNLIIFFEELFDFIFQKNMEP